MADPRFDVLWAASAERDLAELTLDWIQDAPEDALALLRRIRARALTLETLPLRGRRVPELADLGIQSVRELIIRPYRLVYEVAAQRVLVLAIFHSHRDLESMLLDRLLRPPG